MKRERDRRLGRDHRGAQPRDAPRAAARRDALPSGAPALVVLLSLVSAVALLALGLSLRPALPVSDPVAAVAADTDVVAVFYAGLNQVLEQGDVALLDTALAPDIVVQLPGQPAGDRATLLSWLAAARAAAPGTRITLSDVLVGRERAAARAMANGGAAQIAGAPLLGVSTTWDASAFLQLRDGQVIAYAPITAPAPLAVVWPVVRLPLAYLAQPLALARVRLPDSRSEVTLQAAHWQVLLAETGMARIDHAGPVQRSVAGTASGPWRDVPDDAQPLMLQPGEALLIPPDVPLTIHAFDGGPTTLAQLGDAPVASDPGQRSQPLASQGPGPTNQSASANGLLRVADGATREPLAAGFVPAGEAAGEEAIVTVTRATLPPGAVLAPHPVAGLQLIAIEAGLLGVAVAAIGPDAPDPTAEVLIQDGFPLARGTAPQLRNAGGTRLDLVIVTIESVSQAAPRASPVRS